MNCASSIAKTPLIGQKRFELEVQVSESPIPLATPRLSGLQDASGL
jgi:hypothetical protein